MVGGIKKERIRNKVIHKMVEMILVEDKLRERLSWFIYLQLKLRDAPV